MTIPTHAEAPRRGGLHYATSGFRSLWAARTARQGADGVGQPPDEARLLLLGGGIGMGVFTFRYQDGSTLFLAGRHRWDDDLAFLTGLAERCGWRLGVSETGGAATARRALERALEHGPVLAFVELAALGHRGPREAYYLVVVRGIDAASGTALVEDLLPEVVKVPLDTLAAARARHRGFRHRLVWLEARTRAPGAAEAARAGVRACVEGLTRAARPSFRANMTLAGLERLAARTRSRGKEGWAAVFPPGPRMFGALLSFYENVELASGPGLLRPHYARALDGAVDVLGPGAAEAAESYRLLGHAWSAAARAALPDAVPAFTRARELADRAARAYREEGAAARPRIEALWRERHALVRGPYPLDDDASAALRERLAESIETLARSERAAAAALEALAAPLS